MGVIGGVVAAVAAIAAAEAQASAARKQDSITAAGITRNMQLQQKANAAIGQTVRQDAQSTPASSIAQQKSSYLDQLRQQQQTAQAQLLRPNLGAAYNQRAQSDQSNENSYSNNLSSLMANIDGPGLQRQQEAYNFGNLQDSLSPIAGQAQSNAFTTGLQAQTVRPNPYLMGLGAAASAYAKGGG